MAHRTEKPCCQGVSAPYPYALDMGEHRSRIGAALLGSAAVFMAAAASTAASNAAGWCNPIVIGLLASALACLIGSVIAFRPVRSGNAAMNHLIRHQVRNLKRQRKWRRLLHRPASKEEHLMLTTQPPPIEHLEASERPSMTTAIQKQPPTLAERLAALYLESKQLQRSLSIGRLTVLAGAIRGISEPTQIELEQRVRAWDFRVEILLPTDDRSRWMQSAALPAFHPTRSLIEPSISVDGLIVFVEQKRACLKEIIERMGDKK